jgi:hypothetical protein
MITLQNFVSISKFWIQYVNRAAKDVSTTELGVIGVTTRPDLNWRETTEHVRRKSIVDPDGIVDGKSP